MGVGREREKEKAINSVTSIFFSLEIISRIRVHIWHNSLHFLKRHKAEKVQNPDYMLCLQRLFTPRQCRLRYICVWHVTSPAPDSSPKLGTKYTLVPSFKRNKPKKHCRKQYKMLSLIGFAVLNWEDESSIKQNMPKC